jgi:hypothetical protein
MKNLGLAVFTLIVLVGCASGGQNASPALLDPAPDRAIIGLNVPSGNYIYFDTMYGDGTVQLTLSSPKSDPKWAPMNALCVRAAPGGDEVCLKFYLAERSRNEMKVRKEVLGDGGKTLRLRDELDGIFHVGESIKVDTLADGNTIQFSVNGALPVVHTLPGKPSLMRFLCSTASCAMRL